MQIDDKNKLFLKPRGVVHGVKCARTGSAHAAEIKMCRSLGGSELVPGGGMNSDLPKCKIVTVWEGSELVQGGGMNSDHPKQTFVKMLRGDLSWSLGMG